MHNIYYKKHKWKSLHEKLLLWMWGRGFIRQQYFTIALIILAEAMKTGVTTA